MYSKNNDILVNRKERLLSLFDEESIFKLVFNSVGEGKITSPFRHDKHAGCYFYNSGNRLYFVDFADHKTHRDCFEAVKDYYHLSFSEALDFIEKNVKTSENRKIKSKAKTELSFSKRGFNAYDKTYWSLFEITSAQLREDNVCAIKDYTVSRTKFLIDEIAYSIYNKGNIKLYFPLRKDFRFITNCGKDDIGGLPIRKDCETIVITKSYKDYRVLTNIGLTVIWLQSETLIPHEQLNKILENKSKVVIIFDNDRVGIEASSRLKTFLGQRAIEIRTPQKKDPADFVMMFGSGQLNEFIKTQLKTI